MEKTEYNIRFIISTKSGKDLAESLRKKILEAFSACPAPDIRFMEYPRHGYELAKEWSEQWGANGLVYVAGGDGSMNEVATALLGTATPMGVLPLGTGNDFTKSMYPWANCKAERYLDELVEHCRNPRVAPVDSIKMLVDPETSPKVYYSINVVSMGYDTVVLKKTYDILKKYPRFRKYAYYLAVLVTAFQKKSYPLRYAFELANGETMAGEYSVAIAAVCNGQYYGSGFQPAPGAILDDGLADYLVAEGLGNIAFLQLIFKFRKGKHLGSKRLKFARVRKGWFESSEDKAFLANYDGEVFWGKRVEFEVLPKSILVAFIEPELH